MDIPVDVYGQRMKIRECDKKIAPGSQKFVHFLFNLSKDWHGLVVFAQFIQKGEVPTSDKAYNAYLDENGRVDLPHEILPGKCMLMLYGTGDNFTIGTTNCLELDISEECFVVDANSTEISKSLYDQMVEKVDALRRDLEVGVYDGGYYSPFDDYGKIGFRPSKEDMPEVPSIPIPGGTGGVSDYNYLDNKPAIEGKTIIGNMTLDALNIQRKGNYALEEDIPDITGLATKQEVSEGLAEKINNDDIAAWAKEPNKPVYTAEDVGAVPKGTFIPTEVAFNAKADTTYVDAQLETKADSSAIPDVSGFATKQEVTQGLETKVDKVEGSRLITTPEAEKLGRLLEIKPTEKTPEMNSPVGMDKTGLLFTKMVEKTSELTNDSGFTTETFVQNAIDKAIGNLSTVIDSINGTIGGETV